MTQTASAAPIVTGTLELNGTELSRLQEALKRCSPGTFEAACQFHRTRQPEQLDALLMGVIERYVERELRPKLKSGDRSLRLVEDLGIDSLTMMEIVLLAEDVLRISVSNEELVHLRTIDDVRRFMGAKLGCG